MESEAVLRKALSAAYRFLARRSHSQEELKAKLLKKGFAPEVTGQALEVIARQGYLNDEQASRQWALNLVEKRCWGRHKVTAYLLHKGITRELIDRVQKQIWQEFDESAVARAALKKQYAHSTDRPSVEKMARFLKSRGFTQEAIYRNLDADSIRNGE
jgi:regulatory protein